MKRRVCAMLCALLLCALMAPAHALTEGDVYFTAVNDTLLPLSVTSMPVWVNGALYVPASVFDKAATGSTLGIHYNYNKDAGMLTLYTINQMLVFDLNRGIVYDQHSGQNLSPRAVTRNAQTYLPVELVCDFFELEDSYTYTQWGYLVRIRDENARLSDARFLDAAGTIMQERMEQLMAAQKQEQSPVNPGKDPAKADPPSQGGSGTTPAPTQPATPALQGNETQICLAVRCQSGEGLERILGILERRQWRALFLFSPQVIREKDDPVRRAIGSGHALGLIGQSEEELADGNAALSHVARTAATVALAPAEQRDALTERGWVCWRETLAAAPRAGERSSAFAQRVIQSLGTSRRTVYLTVDEGISASALNTLLTQLEQQGHTMLTPLEPRL